MAYTAAYEEKKLPPLMIMSRKSCALSYVPGPDPEEARSHPAGCRGDKMLQKCNKKRGRERGREGRDALRVRGWFSFLVLFVLNRKVIGGGEGGEGLREGRGTRGVSAS